MRKVYCDFCGKEINEIGIAGYLYEYDELHKCNRRLFVKEGENEVCLRCMKRIKAAIGLEVNKIKEEVKNA